MSEADALLAAICEAPEDDAPRLVYADWLEEHGQDPWAQAIRLQCEVEREPDQVKGMKAKYILWELRDRLLAPLRELGFDTSPSFGPPDHYVNNPIQWDFRRGFVAEVSVGAGDERVRFFSERVDLVFRRFPLQHLRIHPLVGGENDNGYCPTPWEAPKPPVSNDTLANLLAHPCLLQLRTLDLSGNDLDDRAAELLATTPNLAGLRALKLGGLTYYTGGFHGSNLPLANNISGEGQARLRQRFGDVVAF
jgi:uncharacterized protein (TIGR02996 family)